MRRVFISIVILSFVLAGAARAVEPSPEPSAPPLVTPTPMAVAPKIHIFSCQVVSGIISLPQVNEAGLVVRFENDSTDELSSITWRAKYGTGYLDFKDNGTFSPQVRIDNFVLFDLGKAHLPVFQTILSVAARAPLPPVQTQIHFAQYVSLNDPENCSIVEATTASEAKWTAPSASADSFHLPSPVPSAAATLAPAGVTPTGAPIDIAHCQVFFPGFKRNAGLMVSYRNLTDKKNATRVVFRASYGMGTIDFTDVGTFSPVTYIKNHQLKAALGTELFDRTYVGFDDPAACVVANVEFEDGTQWKNPDLKDPQPAPTPVKDGLDLSTKRGAPRWRSGLALPVPSVSPSASPAATNSPSPRRNVVTNDVLK